MIPLVFCDFVIKQFATVNQIKFTSPEGQNVECREMEFREKVFFGMMIKKRSEFGPGSAFFGISEVGFLPMGAELKSYRKRMEC